MGGTRMLIATDPVKAPVRPLMVLGIDPGLYGGIAFYSQAHGLMSAAPMPLKRIAKPAKVRAATLDEDGDVTGFSTGAKREKALLDEYALAMLIREFKEARPGSNHV